jgi:hypothetical protein
LTTQARRIDCAANDLDGKDASNAVEAIDPLDQRAAYVRRNCWVCHKKAG